jgi:hypothetical protein
MRNPIQIIIPEPCSQKWEEMLPADGGRFCGQCQTKVIDFSTWSDSDLYHFFSRNTMPVCGRFLTTQLDRPVQIPHQPHSRLYRMTVAMGLTLIFMQGTDVYAQSRPPQVAQTAAPTQATDTARKATTPVDTARKAPETTERKEIEYFRQGAPVRKAVPISNPQTMPTFTQGGPIAIPQQILMADSLKWNTGAPIPIRTHKKKSPKKKQ